MEKLEGEEEAADLMKTSFLRQSGPKHDEGSLVWVLKGKKQDPPSIQRQRCLKETLRCDQGGALTFRRSRKKFIRKTSY